MASQEIFRYYWVGEGVAVGVRLRLHEAAREDAAFQTALEQALKTVLNVSLDFGAQHLRVLPSVLAGDPVELKTRGVSWVYYFVALGRDRILLFDDGARNAAAATAMGSATDVAVTELTLREATILAHTLCVDTVAAPAHRSVTDMLRATPRK